MPVLLWTQRQGIDPAARAGAAMAYDEQTKDVAEDFLWKVTLKNIDGGLAICAVLIYVMEFRFALVDLKVLEAMCRTTG